MMRVSLLLLLTTVLLLLVLLGAHGTRRRVRGTPVVTSRRPPSSAEALASETLQLFADSVVFSAEETFHASPSFKRQLAVTVLRSLLLERQLPVPPAPVLEEAVERAVQRLRLLARTHAFL